MLNCELTETMFYDEERRGSVIVYGLRFFPIGGKDKPIITIDDLFCERHQAVAAMERINVDGISEIHINDIIEDILIEAYEYAPAV